MKTTLSPFIIRISIFLGLGLIAAFSVSEWAINQEDRSNSRSPASTPPNKHEHNIEINNGFKHTEKLLAPVAIQLLVDGELPQNSGDEFQLKALVKSRYDIEGLNIEWILPEGIQLISGALEDTLYSVKAGEVNEIVVRLAQLTNSNEQIHFRVKSFDAQLPFGASAQFNSLDQGEIDESVEALTQRAKEYMENQKAKLVE